MGRHTSTGAQGPSINITNVGGGTPTPTPTGTPTAVLEHLEYIDEENGFTILYPANWEIVPLENWAEETLLQYWAGEEDIECFPQFTVNSVELSQPMYVEAWFEEVMGNLTAAEAYTPISEEGITVDGAPAIKHVFSIGYSGTTVEIMRLYVVEDTFGWTVACTFMADCWPQYEPTFDTVVASFRLLD